MYLIIALLYVVLVNALAILVFGSDKARAIRGDRRISEADLLFLAKIGGSPGMLWARRYFRHKTIKEPFGTILQCIAMVQAGLLLGLAITWATI